MKRIGKKLPTLKHQFTAIIEKHDDWHIGRCPEVPGANGQGRTREECREDLAAAVELMLEYYRDEAMREASKTAEVEMISVG